jgi:hypothetical protein
MMVGCIKDLYYQNFYGYETLSFTAKEERKLQILEVKVLQKTSVSERDEKK